MLGSTRRIAASALAIIAAFVLLIGGITGYAANALFSSKGFSERATAALDDDAVRAEIGRRVADDLVLKADADLVAVRPIIEEVVSGLVGSGAFRGVFKKAVADVHSAVFEGNEDSVTLTLADIGLVLRGALEALAPKLAEDIRGKTDVDLTEIEPPGWLTDTTQLAEGVKALAPILLVVGLALAVLAIWLSPERRRTALVFGIAVVLFGVVAAVALRIAETATLARLDESGTRDAVGGIWDAFLGDLGTGLVVFAACGAVIAAAASSLLRPVDLFAPLRWIRGRLETVPRRPWLRAVRAVVLVVVGIAIVVRPLDAVELFVILVGLYVAYAGVSELMRLTIVGETSEREAVAATGRRTLIAAGIAAAAILVIGGAYTAGGGIGETPAKIETTGCNGSRELCDRPLDDVVFAGTHNAMSAVTNKDWLFGQQDAGFPDQLRDGVRALFIDAHYGQPTESGQVKTDLSDLTAGERATYEDALGPKALNAALRLRDRAVNSPTTGPRQVYLCHRFCELGAVPIVDAFREFRDFLAANTDEVLVVVIEDYVKPDDIAAAAKESGLEDYVYKGTLEPPPTLQEVIDSGGRAVMMAEKDAGKVPWYHPAYESLVQETPYSFKRTEELADPKKLPASCAPNRGPDDAPFFLINHWIDTSPAPKPSNAKVVNSRDVLLRRIQRCERIRGIDANLISVDFYREGDLFEVVDELNAERGE